MPNLVLSYSALKDYDNCPRKFHQTRILKKYKSERTDAIVYGEEMHKVAEEHVANGAAVPESFKYLEPVLDAVVRKEGDKYPEYKMAVTHERVPCDWFDPEAWMRGIADLLIISPNKNAALVFDYKTGNHAYADVEQLRLMALLTFAHFPEVNKVNGALLFVLKNRVVKFSLERKDEHTERGWGADAIVGRAARISASLTNDEWQPSHSGLCRYCPVTTCEFR
jgi:PD-(D/E)XK nuclease superfamily